MDGRTEGWIDGQINRWAMSKIDKQIDSRLLGIKLVKKYADMT